MSEQEDFLPYDHSSLHNDCLNHKQYFLLWVYKKYKYRGGKAEDLFKDTLILIDKRFSDGTLTTLECCPLTLLIRFGEGLIIDDLRKKQTADEHERPLSAETEQIAHNETEAQIENDQFRADLDRYLSVLCELDRNIIADMYSECLNAQTIAEKRGLPGEGYVWTRICRAKQKIRERFGDEWKMR
jgi:RNA polymerase sigma factor (sigma-70 family)